MNIWPLWSFRFQEIVPLNAGNILGAEDNGPANKWLWLIRKTLNSPDTCGSDSYHTPSPVHPILEMYADFEMSSTRQRNSSFQPRRSFHSSNYTSVDVDNLTSEIVMDHRFSFCDRFSFESRSSDFDSNFGCEGSSDDDNFIVEDLSPAVNFSSHGYGLFSICPRKDYVIWFCKLVVICHIKFSWNLPLASLDLKSFLAFAFSWLK